MRGLGSMGVILVVGMLGGCRPKPPPPAPQMPPPADAQVVQQLRESYQRIHPGTRVGLVTAVAPDVTLAAVQDIDLKSFKKGDILTLIDSQEQPVANGTVVNITPDALHVKYTPVPGGRAPQQGDLAVALQNR